MTGALVFPIISIIKWFSRISGANTTAPPKTEGLPLAFLAGVVIYGALILSTWHF